MDKELKVIKSNWEIKLKTRKSPKVEWLYMIPPHERTNKPKMCLKS